LSGIKASNVHPGDIESRIASGKQKQDREYPEKGVGN
jgi:hypothetical protein